MRILGLALLFLPVCIQAEEYSFDISSYEKPAYELGGYVELFTSHAELNSDSALYNLQLANTNPVTDNNLFAAGAQLEGLYRFSDSLLHFQYYVEAQDSDITGNQNNSLFLILVIRILFI